MKKYLIPDNIKEIYVNDLGVFYYIRRLIKDKDGWIVEKVKKYASLVETQPSVRTTQDIMGLGMKED